MLTTRNDGFSALVKAETLGTSVNRYNDASTNRTDYPVVVDSKNVGPNRTVVAYVVPGVAATAGRDGSRWQASTSSRSFLHEYKC